MLTRCRRISLPVPSSHTPSSWPVLQKLIGSLAVDCEEGGSNASAITNLLAFQEVEEITGHLRIRGCPQLTDLKGLSKLKSELLGCVVLCVHATGVLTTVTAAHPAAIKGESFFNTDDGREGFSFYFFDNPLVVTFGRCTRITATPRIEQAQPMAAVVVVARVAVVVGVVVRMIVGAGAGAVVVVGGPQAC